MGKIQDLWNGRHRSFVRYAVVATVVFILIAGFFGEDNAVRWIRSGMELRTQRQQIENYKSAIEAMDAQIRMLTNDRDTLEEFARERFHFAAPGDDVYLIDR